MNAKRKTARGNPARSWREVFQRRRPMHDPMLVLNMSIFNLGNGWDRTFNPFKARQNETG